MSCRVDTTPLIAGACVVSLFAGHGVAGSAVPSTGTHGPSPVYNDLVLPADAAKEYRWAITVPPASGTLLVYEDCSYAYTPPGGTVDLTVTYTYRLWQDGVDMGTAVETIVIGAGSDAIAPTFGGPLTVGAVTSSSIQVNWLSATDNVAVTAYELSFNGGAWSNIGNVLTSTLTGLSPGTSYTISVRARDASGNVSGFLQVTQSTASSADVTAPVLVGQLLATSVTHTSYVLSWSPGSDNVGVDGYQRSLDGGATWVDVGNVTSILVSGRTPGATETAYVRARDAAGNVSAPAISVDVTLLSGVDTSPPVMQGALIASAVTQSSYTLSWAAGTDDVAVAAYERSIDGGLSWVSVGAATSVSIGGRVPGTTDVCMVRALDSSGNISTPAITTTVTLLSSSSGIIARTPLYSGYAALRASISNWLHRSDVDERIPEFIQLAEARIARDLRLTRQLSSFTVSCNAGIALAALPSDWLESQRLRINSPYTLLTFMPPVQFADTYLSSVTGLPRHFCVEGTFLRLGPTPDQAYDIDALYFARVPSLVDQSTNWLLEDHPGIYLWGALAQAATFIRDDEHVTLWEAKYRAEIEDAKKADMRAASSAGRLRIRAR